MEAFTNFLEDDNLYGKPLLKQVFKLCILYNKRLINLTVE